jgi:glycosyltransferase involved in cell wall biosynthesis
MLLAFAVSTVFASMFCAAVPAVLFCMNLRRYRAPLQTAHTGSRVAVLIPARDEERTIRACLESVLASADAVIEVLVLDDASTDNTAAVVEEIAQRDPRLRLLRSQRLPAGWNGKQHACWLLARQADAPLLLFLDADVRLAPDAVARCVAQMQASGVALLSGFPRQLAVGWMEQLLLPLIHFVLLGFLPMEQMRRTTNSAYAAGCGQFFLVERDAYIASGGHAAIRETRHDGLRLPELFRRHKYRTDLVDLTSLAEVRMYDSARAVWMGLAKNATEGLASPARIVPFSVLLVLGQIIPLFAAIGWAAIGASVLFAGARFDQPLLVAAVSAAIAIALVANYLPRLLAVRRFRQPLISALLHPLGVLLLLAVQWYALTRQLLRRPVAWRARSYSSSTGEEVPEPESQLET